MKEPQNLHALLVKFVLALGVSCLWPYEANAQAKANTPEGWVIQQVQAGKEADLNDSQFREAPSISASFLQRLLTNSLAGMKVHPHGVQISNATVTDAVDLRGSEVPFDVWLKNCSFHDGFDCSMAHFKRNLAVEGTNFKNGVDFSYADISGFLSADGATFENKHRPALFNNMRVGGDVSFVGAFFKSTANFAFINVSGTFSADKAQFQKRSKPPENGEEIELGVNGDSIVVKGHLFLRSVIKGRVYFGYSNITGSVFLGSATFSDRLDFGYAHITGSVFLEAATFNDWLNFGSASIGGDVWADDTTFSKSSENLEDAILNGDSMTVGGSVFLRKASFQGVADLRRARLGNDLELSNAKFAQPPFLFRLRVGDTAYLDVAEIHGLAEMGGMTYQNIYGGPGGNLLSLIKDHAGYNPDIYSTLEDVYKHQGRIDEASEVLIAAGRRERAEMSHHLLRNWNFLRVPLSYFEDGLAGYGHRLWRLLIWGGGFVVMGWLWPFRKEDLMETRKPEDAERYRGRYRPFWYSLSAFLPVIDLGDANTWTPKWERRWTRLYLRFHILLGYLLIPIGLAALTGIIK